MTNSCCASSRPETIAAQDCLYASFLQRAVALCIDLALLSCFHLGAAFVSCAFLFPAWSQLDMEGIFHLSGSWLFAFMVILLLTSLLYSAVMHAGTGQTVGKRCMGIRLIALDGRRPSFWQCVLRWFASWLSALPFGAGFFWMVLHSERCGWHDSIAATRVIIDESLSCI